MSDTTLIRADRDVIAVLDGYAAEKKINRRIALREFIMGEDHPAATHKKERPRAGKAGLPKKTDEIVAILEASGIKSFTGCDMENPPPEWVNACRARDLFDTRTIKKHWKTLLTTPGIVEIKGTEYSNLRHDERVKVKMAGPNKYINIENGECYTAQDLEDMKSRGVRVGF